MTQSREYDNPYDYFVMIIIFPKKSSRLYRYFLQMSLGAADKWHANSACLMPRISCALIPPGCRMEIRFTPFGIGNAVHLIRPSDPEDNLLKTRWRPVRGVSVWGLRKIRHEGKPASYISPWIHRGVATRGIIIAWNIPGACVSPTTIPGILCQDINVRRSTFTRLLWLISRMYPSWCAR